MENIDVDPIPSTSSGVGQTKDNSPEDYSTCCESISSGGGFIDPDGSLSNEEIELQGENDGPPRKKVKVLRKRVKSEFKKVITAMPELEFVYRSKMNNRKLKPICKGCKEIMETYVVHELVDHALECELLSPLARDILMKSYIGEKEARKHPELTREEKLLELAKLLVVGLKSKLRVIYGKSFHNFFSMMMGFDLRNYRKEISSLIRQLRANGDDTYTSDDSEDFDHRWPLPFDEIPPYYTIKHLSKKDQMKILGKFHGCRDRH